MRICILLLTLLLQSPFEWGLSPLEIPKDTRGPNYQIENFYYYDDEHKQQPLPLTGNIFLFKNSGEEIIKNLPHKLEKLSEPHQVGRLMRCQDVPTAFAVMRALSREKIDFSPVVKWQGVDALLTKRIVLKTKNFVTEDALRRHLAEVSKVNIVNLTKREKDWLLEVGDPVIPSNILMLANLLAEDSAWFIYAQIDFQPLYAPIHAYMTISPAVFNLGCEKQLDIFIDIFKPSVNVRKDLLPKFGQNNFVPQPPKDEMWFDIIKTDIKESQDDVKRRIKITTIFRLAYPDKYIIPPVEIPYEDLKVQGTIGIAAVSFAINSVTDGKDFIDIQDRPNITVLEEKVLGKKEVSSSVYAFIILWSGRIIAVIGILLVAISGILIYLRHKQSITKVSEKDILWKELACIVDYESDWQEWYKKIEVVTQKLLREIYGPNQLANINENWHAVFTQLTNLYKAKPEPNQSLMKRALLLLIEQDWKR